MGEFKCPRIMLTKTRFVKQNLCVQYESQNGSVLCKLRMIHDRDRIGAKQAQMGELQCPRLILPNTRFLTQNLLIEHESQNGSILCKLCTIHDRECNRTTMARIGELKFVSLMLTISRFRNQNLLTQDVSQNDPILRKLCIIHDRERNGANLVEMGGLKFPRLMLTSA